MFKMKKCMKILMNLLFVFLIILLNYHNNSQYSIKYCLIILKKLRLFFYKII